MSNTPPNLGNVIPSGLARKIIYAAYTLALVAAGAAQVWFGFGHEPEWLLASLRVLTYLGIPVGTLALANAPKTPPTP